MKHTLRSVLRLLAEDALVPVPLLDLSAQGKPVALLAVGVSLDSSDTTLALAEVRVKAKHHDPLIATAVKQVLEDAPSVASTVGSTIVVSFLANTTSCAKAAGCNVVPTCV